MCIYIYIYKLFFLTSSPATVDIVDICKSNSCRLSFTHTYIGDLLDIYWMCYVQYPSLSRHSSNFYNIDERAPWYLHPNLFARLPRCLFYCTYTGFPDFMDKRVSYKLCCVWDKVPAKFPPILCSFNLCL